MGDGQKTLIDRISALDGVISDTSLRARIGIPRQGG